MSREILSFAVVEKIDAINAVLLRSKWPLAAVIPEIIPGVETIPSHVLAVLLARREE